MSPNPPARPAGVIMRVAVKQFWEHLTDLKREDGEIKLESP